jgi:hypothetical protein
MVASHAEDVHGGARLWRVPFGSAVPKDAPMDRAQRTLNLWFWSAVAVSLGFVLVIPLQINAPELAPRLLGRLMLTRENNLAAWWSGALLFMLAVHAFGAALAHRAATPAAAPAWTVIAGVLLFFSADEIGSIHERAGQLGQALGVGPWGLVLPLGAMVGGALIYALRALWRAGAASRRLILPVLIGFALLGSVAGQEFLEHRLTLESAFADSIRATIEEGTELLGMLVLLATILPLTLPASQREGAATPPLFHLAAGHARMLFAAVFVLIPAFTAFAIAVGDTHLGRLPDWLASTTFLAVTLFALRHVLGDGVRGGARLRALAGLGLVASIGSVAIAPSQSLDVAGVPCNARLLVLGAACMSACAVWLIGRRAPAGQTLLGAAALAVAAVLAPVVGNGTPQVFLAMQLLAVLAAGCAWLALNRSHGESTSR